MSLQRSLLIFKVVVLVGALFGVLYLIRHLNEETVAKGLEAVGVEAGGASSPGFKAANRALKSGESQYNLCRTRVKSVVWPDGRKIEEAQDGMKTKWVAFDPAARDIGFLDIEKWFSVHCQIVVAISPGAPTAPLTNVVTFEFIDGTSLDIKRGQNGLFDTADSVFASDDLKQALGELATMARFQPSPQ